MLAKLVKIKLGYSQFLWRCHNLICTSKPGSRSDHGVLCENELNTSGVRHL
jgi:hypothetical protein